MIDGVKRVWAVNSGAYENNDVDWVFPDEESAGKYTEHMNAKEEAKWGSNRPMDSHYSYTSYKMAESYETAIAEDDRMDRLYESDRDAWLKEIR